MQAADWTPEHCRALREYQALGMSYAQIARAINERFATAYSRSAALGRARRMGIVSPGRPGGRSRPGEKLKHWLKRRPKAKESPRRTPRKHKAADLARPAAVLERAKPKKLRCVEIVPRHLALVDLEAGDCRYPYGGDADGEAITFCGHPRRDSSSYCTPHFHLTRGPGTASERTAVAVALRLVKAA
jgi:GcrA cell cycle regulator